MPTKTRISATVDEDAVQAGRKAIAEGRAENLSAWINSALHDRAEHDERMRGLDRFIAEYEREYGVISQDEIDAAWQSAEARAVRVMSGRDPAAPEAKRRVAESRRDPLSSERPGKPR